MIARQGSMLDPIIEAVAIAMIRVGQFNVREVELE